YLATGSEDHTARVWEVSSGREVARLPHVSSVNAAAFSPDGKYLATGSEDHTARVWEVSSGREVARLPHEVFGSVRGVAFSPDGKYLTTRSFIEKTVQVWLWRPKDMIAKACTSLTRNLTREEWSQYLSNEPYRKTCPNLPPPTSEKEVPPKEVDAKQTPV